MKGKQKCRFLPLLLMLAVFSPLSAFGATVTIDGNQVVFSEDTGKPFIDENNRVQVPLRKTMEDAGCFVSWDEDAQTATVERDGIQVRIPIGQKYIIKGNTVIDTDTRAIIRDGRTYLPIRSVLEAFGAQVQWDDSAQTVTVFTETAGPGVGSDPLSAKEIAEKASPAVFFIEGYQTETDYANHYVSGTGSGFFIGADGVGVTNYHVVEHMPVAVITMTDGSQYRISQVLHADEKKDYAIIRVSDTSLLGKKAESFPLLPVKSSQTLSNGDVIYAIGSPLGLQNSISDGIISNRDRLESGKRYIQFTAPISSGSSGGALVDEYGNAVGITTGSLENGQNLNLAVPMDEILKQDLTIGGTELSFFYREAFRSRIENETVGLFERTVSEQNSERRENYQQIQSGDTVIGNFCDALNEDYYYFTVPIPVQATITAGIADMKPDDGASGRSEALRKQMAQNSFRLALDASSGNTYMDPVIVGEKDMLQYRIQEVTLQPGTYYIKASQKTGEDFLWEDCSYYVYLKLSPLS